MRKSRGHSAPPLRIFLNNAVAAAQEALGLPEGKARETRLATLRNFAVALIRPGQLAVQSGLLVKEELVLVLAASALASALMDGGEVPDNLPMADVARRIYEDPAMTGEEAKIWK